MGTDEELFLKKGLCGLSNLGNTCFMNSIIQCINSNISLAKYTIHDKWKLDINREKVEHNLVEQWVLLSKALWKQNCVVTPTSFHRCVQILALKNNYPQFLGLGQNDSQEFLQFFLEQIHNGISKEVVMNINGKPENDLDKMAIDALTTWKRFFNSDYSFIIDQYYGQLCSAISTPDDPDFKSNTYDPFSTVSLEIPENEGKVSLEDCLIHYTSSSEIEYGQETDSKQYHRTIKFWSTPKNLIIFFKRFDNDNNKINTIIDFPHKLDISEFCIGYDIDDSMYDLYAISNHGGGTGGGHYWASIKNMDNIWYRYDDRYVTKQDENTLVNDSVYCLFYRKVLN